MQKPTCQISVPSGVELKEDTCRESLDAFEMRLWILAKIFRMNNQPSLPLKGVGFRVGFGPLT